MREHSRDREERGEREREKRERQRTRLICSHKLQEFIIQYGKTKGVEMEKD